MVGLDICGVDVVCESIQRPLEEQNGGIVEVNAAPGLRMHISPSYGKGRDVGKAVIEHMYASGDHGRVPVIAVTGTNGKTTTVRLIAHLMRSQGLRVGMTNTDGVYVNGRQTDSGDCSGPRSARNVLMHPEMDVAVFETARGGLLREGLAFDRCQVAVVTNLGTGDHLGLNYITTLEDLTVVKRVIVLNVEPSGMAVLNANDPAVAAMGRHCPGDVTFFGLDANQPVLATHRAQGKRVVYIDKGDIVAQTRDVFAKIDGHLASAGTDKHHLLTVQIWLKDITKDFAGMNSVWAEWAPKNALPTRATGEVKLAAPDLLVEVIVSAAKK
jgi:cyanophycin synthetase